jgi:hypothetical protein
MAILETLGVLAAAKSYTTGQDQASLADVIDLGAVANTGLPLEAWVDIDCYAAAVGAGAITIDIVIADAATLDSNVLSIMRVYIAAITDARVATAGAKICACTLPYFQMDAHTATKKYLGALVTVAGTSVGLNIALSPSKPRTKDNVQVIRSNVDLPS